MSDTRSQPGDADALEARDEDIRTILDIALGWSRFKTDRERLEAIVVYGEGCLERS